MINTTCESLEARKSIIFQRFSFHKPLKGVRALKGYFDPLWSKKLKVAFHQFHVVGFLKE